MRWIVVVIACAACNTADPHTGIDGSIGDAQPRDHSTRHATDAATHDGGGSDDGIDVTWSAGCWYKDSGHAYQAMSFQLTTQTPVPLEGTLYFTTNCDPSGGTDNLNDTGATTPSGNWTFWFIHHHDNKMTSAIWSMGALGDHPSPCIDYTSLPDC